VPAAELCWVLISHDIRNSAGEVDVTGPLPRGCCEFARA
jgi:hypothetical protein